MDIGAAKQQNIKIVDIVRFIVDHLKFIVIITVFGFVAGSAVVIWQYLQPEVPVKPDFMVRADLWIPPAPQVAAELPGLVIYHLQAVLNDKAVLEGIEADAGTKFLMRPALSWRPGIAPSNRNQGGNTALSFEVLEVSVRADSAKGASLLAKTVLDKCKLLVEKRTLDYYTHFGQSSIVAALSTYPDYPWVASAPSKPAQQGAAPKGRGPLPLWVLLPMVLLVSIFTACLLAVFADWLRIAGPAVRDALKQSRAKS